jgi:hypothetical protein
MTEQPDSGTSHVVAAITRGGRSIAEVSVEADDGVLPMVLVETSDGYFTPTEALELAHGLAAAVVMADRMLDETT